MRSRCHTDIFAINLQTLAPDSVHNFQYSTNVALMRNCVQKASKLRLNTNSNRLLHPFIFVIFILPKLKMVQFAKEVHAVVISEKRSSPLSHIGLDAPLCLMRPAPLPLSHRSIKCYNFILSARQPLKVESSSIFFATFSFLSFSFNFFTYFF